MKKLLALFIAILLASASQAQSDLSLGAKIGSNYSNLIGSDIPAEAGYKLGLHAGAVLDIALTPTLSIRPELLYSQKGTTVKFMGPDWESVDWESVDWEKYFESPEEYEFEFGEKEYVIKEHLHYLDIPIMAHFKVGKVFLQAGPSASIFLTSKTETNSAIFGAPEEEEEENAGGNEYKPLDLGYVLGAGYRFSNGLELSARYHGAFTHIDKHNNYKAKNSVLQLSLSYIIGVK